MRASLIAALSTAAFLAVAAPAAAQTAAIPTEAEIEAILQSHNGSVDEDRAAVARILQTDAAARAAATTGVDIAQAQAAVRLLEGEQLARAGALARAAEAQLAGGQTVTFNATTIIIVLLVVIVVVLIAD